MTLTSVVRLFCDSLLSIAYPQPCSLCGLNVERRELGIACADCWKRIRLFDGSEPICWKCGVTAPGDALGSNPQLVRCHRCDGCSFTAARACGVYEGVLRESVLKLKRDPYLSTRLVELLVQTAMRPPLDLATRIVPVPLHPRRYKTRGFNQAAVIAAAIGQALRLPVDDVSICRSGPVERYRAGLDAKGRREMVAGVFHVRHPELIKA